VIDKFGGLFLIPTASSLQQFVFAFLLIKDRFSRKKEKKKEKKKREREREKKKKRKKEREKSRLCLLTNKDRFSVKVLLK